MHYLFYATSAVLLLASQLLAAKPGSANSPDSLHQLLETAYVTNPSLLAMRTGAAARKEMGVADSSLMDPMIGISQNNMPEQKRYWMIGQKFDFPASYRLRREAADVAAKMESLDADQFRLSLRAQIISAWFELQSVFRIKSLSRSDLENLKELSRSAESKYAAGIGSMQDFMKAHLMQTEIESELIDLEREEAELRAKLANFIGIKPEELIVNEEKSLAPPMIKQADQANFKAPGLQARAAEVEAAGISKEIAQWRYAPDFTVKYQQSFPGEDKTERMISLELTVPLWINGKSAENRAASLNHLKKDYDLKAATRSLEAQIGTLQAQSQSHLKMLNIIQSSMIPQATTSFEALQSAYKANKANFTELLEAERMLFKVQSNYWRVLAQYVESTAQLEAALGYSITDLKF